MNTPQETYNPWSIVNLVFRHLVDEGLHPVLGETGDPGAPAAGLLRAFGITPAAEGSNHVSARAKSDLARLREAFEAGHFSADERLQRCHGAAARRAARRRGRLSQVESTAPPDPGCDPEHEGFRKTATDRLR